MVHLHKHYKLCTKAWIRKRRTTIGFSVCCFVWIHHTYDSWSFILSSKLSSQRLQNINHHLKINPSLLLFLSNTDSDLQDIPKDKNLHDILRDLDQQFQYEGRLPSDYSVSSSSPSPSKNQNNDFPFRCGFIALVGAPNMGKSSLVNALLEEELCITTHRPQTTRHAILAILNAPMELKCQLCFLDTPGIIDSPAYKLQEGMMEAVQGAFQDADVLLLVTDIFSTPIPNDVLFQRVVYLSQIKQKKVIVAINKVDLLQQVIAKNHKKKQQQEQVEEEGGHMEKDPKLPSNLPEAIMYWRQLLPDAIAILPMCASNGGKDVGVVALRSLLMGSPNIHQVFENLSKPILPGMFLPTITTITEEYAKQIIPISPPLYGQDTLTDRNSRFFASEIIRASLFCKLGKELPYCCEVRIDEFLEPHSNVPTTRRTATTTTSTRIPTKLKTNNTITAKRIIRIKATIHVERDSQKSIVIGKGGEKVKDVGMDARIKLEEFFQEKVHLDLFVKVDKDWRKNEAKLKDFGYLH